MAAGPAWKLAMEDRIALDLCGSQPTLSNGEVVTRRVSHSLKELFNKGSFQLWDER